MEENYEKQTTLDTMSFVSGCKRVYYHGKLPLGLPFWWYKNINVSCAAFLKSLMDLVDHFNGLSTVSKDEPS